MQALLDRDHALNRLEAALVELPAGGPPALIVEGEPGIGKTRLLGELAERTRARNGMVVMTLASPSAPCRSSCSMRAT